MLGTGVGFWFFAVMRVDANLSIVNGRIEVDKEVPEVGGEFHWW